MPGSHLRGRAATADYGGFNQICPRVDRLTAARAAHPHERGLAVRAWGVRHRFEVERLVETGADGATVDCPDWLIGIAA